MAIKSYYQSSVFTWRVLHDYKQYTIFLQYRKQMQEMHQEAKYLHHFYSCDLKIKPLLYRLRLLISKELMNMMYMVNMNGKPK